MKKIIMSLFLVMALVLTACNTAPSSQENKETTNKETTKKETAKNESTKDKSKDAKNRDSASEKTLKILAPGYDSGYLKEGIDKGVQSFEKKNPEDQINKIKENHPEAEINSINIDSKKVRVEEDEKELLNKVISTADLLNDSYRTETKLWLSDMRNTDFRKIRTEIEDNNEKASKSMKEYSEIFLSEEVNSEELKTLYLMLSQNVETREQIVNEFHNRNLENAKKTYYDFIKTLFTFVNYHNM